MSENKQRHGCLTAYLILLIVANSATSLIYLLGSNTITQNAPNMPGWASPILIAFSVFNLICAIALFKWKKWGFWGCCMTAVIMAGINLSIGLGIKSVLSGLVGIAILYGVLQIGKENKGWIQLD